MISFDGYETLVAASMVLVVGGLLVSRVKWLKYYSIPEPVVGGVIAALGLFVLQSSTGIGIQFDKALSTPLMLCFFASIGLNAEIASLRRGGKPLAKLVMVVVAFLFVQNFVGVSMAKMLGLDPLIGLVAGSITLTGGHGTGAAWGALFSEKYGLASATELAMACATFGLVSGGLIGGPVRRARKHLRGPHARARNQRAGDDRDARAVLHLPSGRHAHFDGAARQSAGVADLPLRAFRRRRIAQRTRLVRLVSGL
jgi:ESS family glutamate:Na+ symporter